VKHTQQATQSIRAIPLAKRREKHVRSVFGGLVFIGAFFLPRFLGFDWKVALVVAGFGAWTISGELVRSYLLIIPAFIRDIKAALLNGRS